MKYKKLIVDHLIKSYQEVDVSKEVYDKSPRIEEIRTFIWLECFKIENEDHLNFLIRELDNKGYQEYKEEVFENYTPK